MKLRRGVQIFPRSDDYRENYDKIFRGEKEVKKEKVTSMDNKVS